jgi:hypothetical protein
MSYTELSVPGCIRYRKGFTRRPARCSERNAGATRALRSGAGAQVSR